MRQRATYAGTLVAAALALASCASPAATQQPVPVSSAWRPALFVDGYGPVGLGPSPLDSTLDQPGQSSLAAVGIQPADLPSTLTVSLPTDGTSLTVASLSYCGGTFASEQARVARRRTVVLPESTIPTIASEAVYYKTVQDAATGLSELRGAAQECAAHRTVASGSDNLTFDVVADDGVDTSGLVPVDRRVVVVTDVTPQSQPSSAYRLVRVWQQRGRVLVGIFYSAGSPQFTTRLDALPSSFTGTA